MTEVVVFHFSNATRMPISARGNDGSLGECTHGEWQRSPKTEAIEPFHCSRNATECISVLYFKIPNNTFVEKAMTFTQDFVALLCIRE